MKYRPGVKYCKLSIVVRILIFPVIHKMKYKLCKCR